MVRPLQHDIGGIDRCAGRCVAAVVTAKATWPHPEGRFADAPPSMPTPTEPDIGDGVVHTHEVGASWTRHVTLVTMAPTTLQPSGPPMQGCDRTPPIERHTMTNTQQTGSARTGLTAPTLTPTLGLVTLGALSLLISLLGTPWVFFPANPAAKAPASTASFSDLKTVIGSGKIPTTWVQDVYFGWFAWVLVIAVIALGVAAVVARSRAAHIALRVVGLVGFVMTVFAFKGEMTWAQYWDGHTNLRLGGYLVFLGFILAAVAGGLRPRRD
ncbi:MAG: hypothetical protein JWO46_310 [Nocardioidaceae bacterium]|nr:hypothetical protein [Nocardioidaceae bacterium]